MLQTIHFSGCIINKQTPSISLFIQEIQPDYILNKVNNMTQLDLYLVWLLFFYHNSRLTKPFSVTRFTKGGGGEPPTVNLKTGPQICLIGTIV